MKQDIVKLVTTKLASMRGELTSHVTEFKATIHNNMNAQIAELLQTIQVLNQCFLDAMDHLPPQTQMPAHKKPKGLGIIN